MIKFNFVFKDAHRDALLQLLLTFVTFFHNKFGWLWTTDHFIFIDHISGSVWVNQQDAC